MDKLNKRSFLAQYSEVHIKVWNTAVGVVIDQLYQVDWDVFGFSDSPVALTRRYFALCPAPITREPLLVCDSYRRFK